MKSLEETKRRVDDVLSITKDFEEFAGEEYNLYVEFIRHVAATSRGTLKSQAQELLRLANDKRPCW